VLRVRRLHVARVGGRREALRERLDRRAVAKVLEALLGGDPYPLLLLLDVRHGVKMPAPAGARTVAERSFGRLPA